MAYQNRQFPTNGRRYNNQGGGDNRGNSRGSYKAGRSFRNNNSGNNEQNYELRGIVWGNKFLDEQKEGAPVLQGFATVNGVKYRVAGFLNVGPDFKDDQGAQEEKLNIAREINNILLDGQDNLGLAFSLVFEDEEERQANNNQGGGQRQYSRGGGGNGGGGYQSRGRGQQQQEEPENIPFNQGGRDDGDAAEPEAPRRARSSRKPATKAAAKSTKTTRTRKASK